MPFKEEVQGLKAQVLNGGARLGRQNLELGKRFGVKIVGNHLLPLSAALPISGVFRRRRRRLRRSGKGGARRGFVVETSK